MNFLAHLHLAHLADSSLSGNLLADFVRGNPATHYPPDVVEGIYMHRRIDVMTDNLPEVREAREWFRHETRRVASITLDVMWDHFLSRHWTQISPDFPLQAFVGYAHAQVATILPDSPPRFVNLNDYLWSEKWLERYRDMDFIQNVLNGMANRRPRLDALRDSWYDLDAHYDALEERFWHFYSAYDGTGRPQSAVTA
ncbi:acyl carrier protein phosphodiesterase [Salmonella enterica subsp. enterica serovar Agona str. 400095 17]|nr:acyl carrier protein phosphodiesterase [Salmonella enterica subsp. enterica serovar Agona str. 400095 17]